MPENIHEDNIGAGLNWDDVTKTLTGTGIAGVIFAGRYLDNTSSTDGTATFIDADTNTNGAWTLSLRDTDHAAGMHYWIRVDSGVSLLTIGREGGSTKTISGVFVGQTFAAVASFGLLRDDGIVRIQPDGDNWTIY